MPGSWRRLGCHIGTACRRRVVYVLLDRHTVIATPGDDPSWFRDLLSDENYMATIFEELFAIFIA
jgi:hypothetical protein